MIDRQQRIEAGRVYEGFVKSQFGDIVRESHYAGVLTLALKVSLDDREPLYNSLARTVAVLSKTDRFGQDPEALGQGVRIVKGIPLSVRMQRDIDLIAGHAKITPGQVLGTAGTIARVVNDQFRKESFDKFVPVKP